MSLNPSADQAARLIESERAQIAHEIHDSVLPLLFASSASLYSLLDHSGESLPPELRTRLQQAVDWIDQAMQTGRRMLTEIYPPELKDSPWSAAAMDAVERLLGEAAQRVSWRLDPNVHDVADPIAFAAYRIVVEAIRNAIDHGAASEVMVSGHQDDREFVITVRDNGQGFDPRELPDDRFGIRSMKGRAELVGGRLTIDSAPGGPTTVTLLIMNTDES